MVELFPKATIGLAKTIDWACLFNQKSEDSTFSLYQLFTEKIKNEPSEEIKELYQLLEQVFSIRFSSEDPSEPFGPLTQFSGSRSAIPTDFTDQNLDIFEYIATSSSDPIASSRLLDILWIRRNKYDLACKAIEKYCEHAKQISTIKEVTWINIKDSLLRALQIWKMLGQQKGFKETFSIICENAISKDSLEPNDYKRVYFLEIASDFQLLDDPSWIDKCEEFAKNAETNSDFRKAQHYWKIGQTISKSLKNDESLKKFSLFYTDSFVTQAQQSNGKVSAMASAQLYAEAIEACRRHGNRRDLVDTLHAEMNALQEQSISEMKSFEGKIDLSSAYKVGRDLINNSQNDELIPNLASLAEPQPLESLRKSVIEAASKYIFQNLITQVAMDDKGRIKAQTGSTLASSEEDRDAAIIAKMIAECTQSQQLLGISTIESARETLYRRIGQNTAIFYDLVTMNPLVPVGREHIYFRGLIAGLRSNYLEAAHLLIPQIEHSIRNAMEQAGYLVTRLTDDLTQKEHDLNSLLYRQETKTFLGEDFAFSIRAQLVEEVGGNYRNKLAHGLLEYSDFHPGWVNYLWVTAIRMLWLGKLHGQSKNNTQG